VHLYNTIIIGAGPVGSYLACKLGQLGFKVLVLDKKSAAGQDICCTGIISKDCLNLLPADLDVTKRPVSSARFVAPSGRSLRLSRREEVAYVVDRVTLEQMLAARAQSAGVDYIFGNNVTNIEQATRCIKVMANGGDRKTIFEAETVVIAAGFGTTLPYSLGLGKINKSLIGVQAEVTVNIADDIEIYFDRMFGVGGFSWLVPVGNNRGLVGQLTYEQPQLYFKNLLAALNKQGKISATEVMPDYRLIPLQPLPKTYSRRILVVGEAAGQVKPVTGGGIYYGLVCADFAADTLHQAFLAGDFSAARLASYEKRWRARLSREFRLGYWAHRFYRSLSNRQIETLYGLVSRDGMPQFIARLDEFPFDWHSQLMLKTLRHLVVSAPALAIRPLIRHKGHRLISNRTRV
jgi:digeranylgeranylglycerophospholipid reductase